MRAEDFYLDRGKGEAVEGCSSLLGLEECREVKRPRLWS